MARPTETIKSYYSAKVCAECEDYHNGMCLKSKSKPYVARLECSKLHTILENNRKERIAEEEVEKQELIDRKAKKLIEIKSFMDIGASNDFICEELGLSKNSVKKHIKFINQVCKVNELLLSGLDEYAVAIELNVKLSRVELCKEYIKRELHK